MMIFPQMGMDLEFGWTVLIVIFDINFPYGNVDTKMGKRSP